MQKQFFKYTTQSVAAMIGFSIYILADTFFISVQSGADGLAVLNLILPVYGLVYAIGSMIGIGSATRYSIDRSEYGFLFYTICFLGFALQRSLYFHRNFLSGEIPGNPWRRSGTDLTGQKLSAYYADCFAALYG